MRNMKDLAYRLIKSRIINSTYVAESALDEKSLMEELGVSRTPVREAIIALEHEGYVRILPKRGIFVTAFSYHDVISVFQVRTLIEPWLIETYGPELSKEELERERQFVLEDDLEELMQPGISINHHPHSLVLAHCSNQYILDMLRYVEEQNQRIPNAGYQRHPSHQQPIFMKSESILKSHLALVDLMLQDDFQGAAMEMRNHIDRGRKSYLNYWFNETIS